MIYDKLSNIQMYKGLYKKLDLAIDYLAEKDFSDIAVGRHEIYGDDVYMNVVETTLKKEEDCVYELHRRYLDIHIDLAGCENVQYADLSSCSATSDYIAADDYQLLKGDPVIRCELHEGYFTICMTDEPHMPCVGNGDEERVKKVIVKVLAE